MRWLRWLGIGLAGLVALLVVVGVVARFSDGPIGPFIGGPLRAGELVSDPQPDLRFAAELGEIELQLLDPPLSRTVWIIGHAGKIYIPCGLPSVKRWSGEAMADGRAVVRIEGRRYPVQLVRVADPGTFTTLGKVLFDKYGMGKEDPGPDDVWMFRVDSRPAAG